MIPAVKEKIILGIDPGTNIMGYGVLKVVGNKPEVITLGVIDLRKCKDPYLKLRHIYERVQGIIASYLPDELAIEAPFFGKNVQSMLKLGRAQGVAMAAALCPGSTDYRICPAENQDGDNRKRTGQQGAGSRYAEAAAAHSRLGNGTFYGCYRRAGGCLLSFSADGQTRNTESLFELEGFREKKSR